MQRHHVLSAMITSVGLVGESAILWHSLVHAYPFKVFTYPTPSFFSGLANVLTPLMTAGFLALAVRVSRQLPIVSPALLTAVLPLVFVAAVAIVAIASHGTHVPAGVRNFDGYTLPQALGEFAMRALSLSGLALIAGGIAAGLVLVFRARQVAGV